MNDETDTRKSQQTRALPDNADPVVDYTTAASRPGLLRGSASLDIQTRQAQRLVYGRRRTENKEHIVGLVRFGMNMKRIWSSAARDDPYADWTLLQVEEALNNTRELINTVRQEIESLLESAAIGVQIDIAHSLQPVRVPLQFANAFGYMGAYLIADFDQLVCAILTGRHVGLIQRGNSDKALHNCARRVRHAFALSGLWKFTLVTRADVHNNTPMALKAQQAMAVMGDLPQEVLDGSHRARIAPEINASTSALAEANDSMEVDNPGDEESS
jgi:integrating conjugative element protein (TIGR03761 family)